MLKKLCERSFYARLQQNLQELGSSKLSIHQVYPSRMQMGCMLMDARTIQGAYIDRTKNPKKEVTLKVDTADKKTYFRSTLAAKEEKKDLSRG